MKKSARQLVIRFEGVLIMRSRALTRSTRLNAKRRRKFLRGVLPELQNGVSKIARPFNHSQEIRMEALHKEAISDWAQN